MPRSMQTKRVTVSQDKFLEKRPATLLDALHLPVNLLWPRIESHQFDSVEKINDKECKFIIGHYY